MECGCRACWCLPSIPVPWRLRREGYPQLEASLGDIARPCDMARQTTSQEWQASWRQ